jgi:hypothetical protein
MHVKVLLLSLLPSAKAHTSFPAYKTVDGYMVSYAEGQAALRSGHAILVGEILVGSCNVTNPVRL